MKNKGDVSFLVRQRNREILRKYAQIRSESSGILYLKDAVNTLVAMPSSRFWVSGVRAAYVVRKILEGCPVHRSETTRRMYDEIVSRAKTEMRKTPDRSLKLIVCDIVRQPAPEFYILPHTAAQIIHSAKHVRA